jgi:hypothetical protein
MTVVIPESVTAEGNVKVAFVPAIASKSAPTVAELTATGAVDLSCYLMPDWGGISADQNKGESRRFCSTESFDQLGTIKRSIGDIVYTYLPQATGTDPANKVYTALQKGTKGYLVIRYGLPSTTAFAAAQKVDLIPVEMGARSKAVAGSDEFAPLTVSQGIGATGVLVEDAAVA